jgi:hypothetical protein
LPTSVLSFVGDFCNEGSPASIVNRLGQHSSRQPFDVQVFDNDCAEVSNEFEGLPMLVLISQSPDSSMNLLKQSNCFTSPITAFLTPSGTPLCSPKSCLSLLIPTRIGNLRAVGQRSERLKTYVHTDCVIQSRKQFRLAFNRETGVPLAAFTFHRDSFNRASNRTVQFNFNFPDPLNPKHITRKPDTVSVTWKGNTIEAATRLKSWIASLLMPLDSKKESLKGFIHSPQDILATREVCQTQIVRSTNVLQLIRLHIVANRDSLFPSVSTLLKGGVVQTASLTQLVVESVRLEASRE